MIEKHFVAFAVACLLLVSLLILSRQFAHPDFASCVIDDSILQMSWIRQFSQVLREGTWLPRWLPDSNGGHGSPVFVFYSPLVYYVTSGFHLAGSSIIDAMKIVRFLGLWLSGLAMFWYLRGLAGGRAGLFAAVVYLILPFHVLDISYWTLYAEPWAWIWFPLILHFLGKMPREGAEGKVLIPGLAFCYAGLILTHLVSAYMFAFVMAGYTWFCSDSSRRLRNSLSLAASVSTALALAAFFLFPAWYERRFVHIEYSTLLPEFNFRNTFLFFPDPSLTASNVFQSRTIFLLQCITMLQCAGMIVSAALIWRWERDERLLRLFKFAFWAALLCLLMMSQASLWIWESVPGLPQIQFSTRWLSIYSLMTALVLGRGLQRLWQSSCRSHVRVGLKLSLLTIGALNVIGSALIVRASCFVGQEEVRKAELNLYNAPEYNPHAMVNWRQRVIEPENQRWWITSGLGKIEVQRWAAHERRLAIDASSEVQLKLRLYNYPGWSIKLDGAPTGVLTDPDDGRVSVKIPSGQHLLELNFANTSWRTMASALSIVSLVLLLGSRRFSAKEGLSA